ncbi:transcription initiation factor TFIID subunit 8 protein [Dioscorea alata]|uniref:Transcription initiation factor TFIID subunit 8 protein n=1 Tax=Dioscorea alata TaxID=55571 RepID=A0ACB7UFE4_DIOAL|nr:transcription initiation factor TFIID subunit 8 protein [Dioscorea alata]
MNGIPIALENLHSRSLSSSFASDAITVAIAQICLTTGCDGARTSVLRALADIAGRYIQTLARSAAEAANARGRTNSNLLDITRAIEDLCSNSGFRFASNPTRPLLKSAVLKEIAAFVRSADEVPFAKPMRRKEAEKVRVSMSFAQAGTEPPLRQVPRWLPCFPELLEKGKRKDDEGKRKTLADSGLEGFGSDPVQNPDPKRRLVVVNRELPVVRARVKFRVGLGKDTRKSK